ncbi:hypothetical protein PWG71_25265 [Nocardiopsis sp. N85]|uniref:hypothetical protein n=1 Tax=Nocardiopsis sp. N85 TaxID=3029400 RepID=UPI00237F9354|nr:hypothetical protein [Nocardiopsis sp. N85]MDE3724710.1 hypothetical protein [Nocardiopsis sp. N85]
MQTSTLAAVAAVVLCATACVVVPVETTGGEGSPPAETTVPEDTPSEETGPGTEPARPPDQEDQEGSDEGANEPRGPGTPLPYGQAVHLPLGGSHTFEDGFTVTMGAVERRTDDGGYRSTPEEPREPEEPEEPQDFGAEDEGDPTDEEPPFDEESPEEESSDGEPTDEASPEEEGSPEDEESPVEEEYPEDGDEPVDGDDEEPSGGESEGEPPEEPSEEGSEEEEPSEEGSEEEEPSEEGSEEEEPSEEGSEEEEPSEEGSEEEEPSEEGSEEEEPSEEAPLPDPDEGAGFDPLHYFAWTVTAANGTDEPVHTGSVLETCASGAPLRESFPPLLGDVVNPPASLAPGQSGDWDADCLIVEGDVPLQWTLEFRDEDGSPLYPPLVFSGEVP